MAALGSVSSVKDVKSVQVAATMGRRRRVTALFPFCFRVNQWQKEPWASPVLFCFRPQRKLMVGRLPNWRQLRHDRHFSHRPPLLPLLLL